MADFLIAATSVRRTRDLWAATLAFLHQRGVRMASYHHVGRHMPNPHGLPNLTIAADGFPADWVSNYIAEELWEVDPITAAAQRSVGPVWWRDVAATDARQSRFLDLLDEADLGPGLAMGLHGPRLRQGYAGLGFGPLARRAAAPSLGPAQLVELQTALQVAHLTYSRLVEERATCHNDLSPRECEILRWIAAGKSNGVIAQILGVSRHTVDTLVRRIFDKLDVADRTTAAIKGLGLGFVAHPPIAA